MELNIEDILAAEKLKLKKDKERLDELLKKQKQKSRCETEKVLNENLEKESKKSIVNPKVIQVDDDHYFAEKFTPANMDFPSGNDDLNSINSLADEDKNRNNSLVVRPTNNDPFQIYDTITRKSSNNVDIKDKCGKNIFQSKSSSISKPEKQIQNEKELQKFSYEEDKDRIDGGGGEDDMEQWVSDTFYSYFPSFNNVEKKRKSLVQDRQLDYQNYLKEIAENQNQTNKTRQSKNHNNNNNNDHELNRELKMNDKSELQIIVNNPDYIDKSKENKNSLGRPGSARQKLLQDLKHTELSNIVHSDGVQKRNRTIAENEAQKKLEYQKELMRQIEDKRKQNLLVKEKEKREEEILTRKLEEQLRTMQLEEELEKVRVKMEKNRFSSEQNQLIREQLLTKLENDRKLSNPYKERQTQSESGKDQLAVNNNNVNDNNKVYRYFSNSARQNEHNKKFFDEHYEQPQISLPLASVPAPLQMNLPTTVCQQCRPSIEASLCRTCKTKLDTPPPPPQVLCSKCGNRISADHIQSNLCENCKREYLVCNNCERNNTPCISCHRKRNVCYDCMKHFCVHCSRPVQQQQEKISSRSTKIMPPQNEYGIHHSNHHSKPNSVRSFKVLDGPYFESEDDFELEDINPGYITKKRPPYSMNLEKNSIFHPDNRISQPKVDINIKNGEVFVSKISEKSTDYMEAIKHNNNERLSKYMKHYADVAERNERLNTKSTQTTDEIIAITPEQYFQFMPLLREMPKNKVEKRTSSEPLMSKNITALNERWEIPAVQKQIVSTSSPRVLTQLGAIRKQLQLEHLELDKNN